MGEQRKNASLESSRSSRCMWWVVFEGGLYLSKTTFIRAAMERKSPGEILIVDEVLAIGRAKSQKTCFGKTHEVATGGRMVLFVSHNMQAIQSCVAARRFFAETRTHTPKASKKPSNCICPRLRRRAHVSAYSRALRLDAPENQHEVANGRVAQKRPSQSFWSRVIRRKP